MRCLAIWLTPGAQPVRRELAEVHGWAMGHDPHALHAQLVQRGRDIFELLQAANKGPLGSAGRCLVHLRTSAGR
jgi:hypothetical protein